MPARRTVGRAVHGGDAARPRARRGPLRVAGPGARADGVDRRPDRRVAAAGRDRDTGQIAARLWDVAPGGERQTLVARGLYRPSGQETEVFQLHPNGYRFAPGHVAKLELLGDDVLFGRPSNVPRPVEVRELELRLPVREAPDCRTVLPVAAPVLPEGQQLAPGVAASVAAGCGGPGASASAAGNDAAAAAAGGPQDDAGVDAARPAAAQPRTGAAADDGDAEEGTLPFTGAAPGGIAIAGLALVLLGAALRRRRAARAGAISF